MNKFPFLKKYNNIFLVYEQQQQSVTNGFVIMQAKILWNMI